MKLKWFCLPSWAICIMAFWRASSRIWNSSSLTISTSIELFPLWTGSLSSGISSILAKSSTKTHLVIVVLNFFQFLKWPLTRAALFPACFVLRRLAYSRLSILRRFLPVLKEIVFLKPFRVVNLTFFEDLENWFIGVVDSWALAKYLGVQLKEIVTMNPPDQNGGHVNNLDGDKKEKRVYKVVLTGGLFQYYAEITV